MTPLEARAWLNLSVFDTLGPLLRVPVVETLMPVDILRDYQLDLLRRAIAAMQLGYRRILLVLPTGGGKTVLASAMMASALAQRDRSQFIVHRKELIDQTSDTFTQQGLAHGFVASGRPAPTQQDLITLAGIQTLVRRLDLVLPPRLAVVDECFAGDTIVETDQGPIEISQIDPSTGVKAACVVEGRLVYRKITRAWKTPSRKTLTIHFSGDSSISCTPEHRIYVGGEWIEARNLKVGQELASLAAFAPAGAERLFSTTQEVGYANTTAIIERKGLGWTGALGLDNLHATHLFAPAVAANRLDLGPQTRKSCANGAPGKENTLASSTVTIKDPRDTACASPPRRDRQFLEHCLATGRSCFPTTVRSMPDYLGTMGYLNQDGCTTKPQYFGNLNLSFPFAGQEVLATTLSGCIHPAYLVSPRLKISLPRTEQRKSQLIGLMASVISAWHGGFVTTDTIPQEGRYSSTPKALVPRKTNLSQIGLETPLFTGIRSGAPSFEFIGQGLPKSYSRFAITFRPLCSSNWTRVEKIETGRRQDVFDLTVDEAHNFFANGILVHNCHHATATSWANVLEYYGEQDCFTLGLTATPERLDGKGLDEHFDVMIVGPSTADLIEAGWLSPFDYYAPGVPDLSGIHTTAGDFNRGEIDELMNEPKLVGDIVSHYLKLSPGEQGIVFAASRNHSKSIVDAFLREGVRAAHVDGAMAKGERKDIVDAHKAGDLTIMSNVEIVGEGFDVPAVSYVGLARPTKSLALHLQQAGRGLRISPGKSRAIICDHAGNAFRHGLPDEPREWSLQGRKGRLASSNPNADATPVHQCETCFRVTPSAVKVCPGCETPFPVKVQTDPKQEAGELAKLERVERAKKRKIEEGQCKTYEDFLNLAIERGYGKPQGWARIRMSMRARGGKR